MTPYESQRLQQLRAWQAEPPGLISRGFGKAAQPASRALQALVPEAALRAAFDGTNKLAARMATARTICRDAGVDKIEQLQHSELERCDALASKVQRRAMALAAGTGAVTGAGGAVGLAIDVPALLALSLRTIHRTGLCYGYDCLEAPQHATAMAVFALASANSMEEKELALRLLRCQPEGLDEAAWRDGLERAAEREMTKEATVVSMQNLARQLGINLGQRKAATVVPLVGALISGSVNAWYMRDLSQAASYAFLDRWLGTRHGDALPPPIPALPA